MIRRFAYKQNLDLIDTGDHNMADLGAIGLGNVIQQKDSYYVPSSGIGKISGAVKENGVDTLGRVMLYDEAARLIINVAVGSMFNFSDISLTQKHMIFSQYIMDTNFNGLSFDRVAPTAL